MKLLRDPLLHFALLGALLLGIHALVSGVFSSEETRRVEIGAAEIELLARGFERKWMRPPTPEELQRLVEGRVREEILYREALALGLDRNDGVVRRRMVQKIEMLTQDLALLADPTPEELRAFFEEHRDEYQVPPRRSFSHVYFNLDQRGAAAEADAHRLLAELRALDPAPSRAPGRGDPTMIESDFDLVTPREVRRVFGDRFAESLFALGSGWQGPVLSGYGLHLVHVGERVEARTPELEEIRDRLVYHYNRVRRDEAREALYQGLAGQYEITIVDPAEGGTPPGGAANESTKP
jgi:hypothetical protein